MVEAPSCPPLTARAPPPAPGARPGRGWRWRGAVAVGCLLCALGGGVWPGQASGLPVRHNAVDRALTPSLAAPVLRPPLLDAQPPGGPELPVWPRPRLPALTPEPSGDLSPEADAVQRAAGQLQLGDGGSATLAKVLEQLAESPVWGQAPLQSDAAEAELLAALGGLSAAVATTAPALTPTDLYRTVLALRKLSSQRLAIRLAMARTAYPMLRAIAWRAGHPTVRWTLTAQQACGLLWAYGKMGVWQRDLLRAISPAFTTPRVADALTAGDVLLAVYGLAVARLVPRPLLKLLGDAVVSRPLLAELTPEEAGTLAWGYARLGVLHRPLFAGLAHRVLEDDSFVAAFGGRAVAKLLWGFSKLGTVDLPVVDRLVNHVLLPEQLESLGPQELAMVTWALANTDLQGVQALPRLAAHATALLPRASARATAGLSWAFARLGLEDPALFAAVAGRVRRVAGQLVAQDAANLAWAFARAGIHDVSLFMFLGDSVVASGLLAAALPREVAILAWAFATARVAHPPLLAAAERSAVLWAADHRRSLGPPPVVAQDVANLLWAFASLRAPCSAALVDALAQLTLHPAVAPSLTPHTVATIAWACAVLRAPHPELLARLAQWTLTPGNLATFPCQGLSTVVWAFMKLGAATDELMIGVAAQAVQPGTLPGCSGQSLAHLAWAYATHHGVGRPTELVMTSLATHLLQPGVLASLSPQGVTMVLWAFATLQHNDAPLVAAIAGHLLEPRPPLEGFTSQGLSLTAWAFARLGYSDRSHRHRRLYTAIAAALLRPPYVLRQATAQEVANVAWAFATQRYRVQPLLEALAERALQPDCLAGFAPQGVASFVWAFGVLDADDHARVLSALAQRALRPDLRGALTAQHRAVLAAALSTAALEDPACLALLTFFRTGALPPGFGDPDAEGAAADASARKPAYVGTPPPTRTGSLAADQSSLG